MDGWIRVAGTVAAAQPAGCVGGILVACIS